jgi:hypothetical protein
VASSLSEELLAIRLELKGVREAVSGLHSVDDAQKGVASSTTRTGVAAEKAEKKTSRLSRAYASLGKTAKWGLGFLGVGGVFALKSAIDNTEELSKTTVGLTRNFGMQTNVASRWAAVAHARDIDSKALGMAFGTLSSRMVEAGRKGGTALTPFHQMGLTQEEVAKGAHNFEWGLMRVVSALGDMEGGAKRTTAAKAAFGKGFQTLVPLMSEGTKGLKEMLHWSDEYGVTLDGKTNSAIMDMVNAQRESKVATLGLQIALTRALMPAIEGGQHELQKFIATLNDPDLSADQKLHRIEQQLLGIEDTLIEIVSDALPRVAEHGGELGVKLAGAVWHGFWKSDLLGKVVIAGWIFRMFGGEALAKAGATRVGGMIGTRMGLGVGAGLIGAYIGYEIWESLSDRTQAELALTAEKMGIDFANFFVRSWNAANPLPFGIGDKGEFEPRQHDLTPAEAFGPPIGKGSAPGVGGVIGKGKTKREVYEGLWGQPPPPGPPPWPPPKRKHRQLSAIETPRLPRLNFDSVSGGARETVVHTHIHLDGKEIAESTARHVAAAEALG